jgi:hypothetical protein
MGMKQTQGFGKMTRMIIKSTFTVGLLAVLLSIPAFGATINKSVKIADGETSTGATSVNGSITVGENAVVTGGLKTVNGSVRVDAGAKIESASTVNGSVKIGSQVESENLSTVNGSIKVGESATVDGDVEAVNGRITIASGASVAEDVSNVNGQIDITGAEISGDVSTVSGDVNVIEGGVVKGDVIVEENKSWGWNKDKKRKPRVVIGPGSTVAGDIVLEQKVDLFISESADVGGVTGVMSVDDAVRFSGDKP